MDFMDPNLEQKISKSVLNRSRATTASKSTQSTFHAKRLRDAAKRT